ncbi:unnamed protein product [Phytomonas sp. EM1]|nr:unnamed protein product [Phytomonas sp. EM1]|eukprot:CCW63857.1 unnamed protein product [Phytomonas sp. isolate EM1]
MRCWQFAASRRLSLAGSKVGRFPPAAFPPASSTLPSRGTFTTTPVSPPLQEEMRAKGFVNSTPNFSCDFTDSSPSPEASFPGGFETTPATGVRLVEDLHGPWLVMTDDLQGELFVDHDGFVYYRPANGIGYGIGQIKLLGAEDELGTAFTCTLMVYAYAATDRFPPMYGITLHITGMVNHVTAKTPQAFSTFSLIGIWQKEDPNNADSKVGVDSSHECGVEGEGKGEAIAPKRLTGQFNAAKLSPWQPTAKDVAWKPNAELQAALAGVFPRDLALSPHFRGGIDPSSSTPSSSSSSSSRPPPFPAPPRVLPHHVDLAPYRVGSIPSIFYLPDYLTPEEEEVILASVRETPTALKTTLPKRTAQEWGGALCEVCRGGFVSEGNFPAWVRSCSDRLLRDGLFTPSTFPNAVRVHEYAAGEGIGPHVDGPIYVPVVAVLSLGGAAAMGFAPRTPPHETSPMEHYEDTFRFADGPIARRGRVQTVVLEPRSLLLFTGDAYFFHPHGVSDAAVDELAPEIAGAVVNRHLLREPDIQRVVRGYRVSVTIRNLLPRCNHQPGRAEFEMKRAWYLYHNLPLPTPLFTASPLIREAGGAGETASAALEAPRGPLPPEGGGRWEARMDRLAAEQAALAAEMKELKGLLGQFVAAGRSSQAETSGVLNSMTKSLLEVDAKLDDLMDELQARK